MENFRKNGTFQEKWKILGKMENFRKNGKFQEKLKIENAENCRKS